MPGILRSSKIKSNGSRESNALLQSGQRGGAAVYQHRVHVPVPEHVVQNPAVGGIVIRHEHAQIPSSRLGGNGGFLATNNSCRPRRAVK